MKGAFSSFLSLERDEMVSSRDSGQPAAESPDLLDLLDFSIHCSQLLFQADNTTRIRVLATAQAVLDNIAVLTSPCAYPTSQPVDQRILRWPSCPQRQHQYTFMNPRIA